MKRLEVVRFVRIKAATSPVLLCLLAAAGIWLFAASSNFSFNPFPGAAIAAEPPNGSNPIDGAWRLSLPMPGGNRESLLVLAVHGNSLSGTMSKPGDPTDVHPIYDGVLQDSAFSLTADIDRITYLIQGTLEKDTLSFDLETTETIPLDDGRRLSGNTGEISGKYLVPVYSPGGIKENHFELSAENGIITGQMYVPVSGDETSPGKMEGPPPDMEAPSGGPPAGAPASDAIGSTSGDKRDINTFSEGTCEGNRISLSTRTAQGSLFHFTGTVEGDAIKLTLHVTDRRNSLEAARAE